VSFDRVYSVNLDRCPDSWGRFARGLPADWPFLPPIRVAAIDGQRVPFPAWWRAGRGAWGVYRSFLRTIEQCLNDGVRSVLLLEDDALFCDRFAERVTAWLQHVPADWTYLYLGGQHLEPPRRLSDHLYECANVNRCHAWALQGQGLVDVYQHLTTHDWPDTRNGKPAHIDHHLGRLHARWYQAGARRVLCPPEWLVGQAGGHSTISGQDLEDRWWRNAASFTPRRRRRVCCDEVDRPVIVVLGQFRGGTSCTAGVLHHLGVNVGATWSTIKGNERGTYEAARLADFCRRAYQEPRMIRLLDHDTIVAGLRDWALGRLAAVPEPAPIGAKHPSLCLMIAEILEAWPQARFVAVQRSVDASVRSMLRVGNWGWPRDQIEPTLRLLAETRDRMLASIDPGRVLRIAYHDLIDDPPAAAQRLADFAGVVPTPEQLAAAVAFVDPQMRTIS
jgi:hypothetical protein